MVQNLLSDPLTNWNFHFCRNLKDSEINKLENLLAIIRDYQIFLLTLDYGHSLLPESSRFSHFIPLSHPLPCLLPFPIGFWFSLSPFKVQAFLWKIAWNHGPSLDIIQVYPHVACFQTLVLCVSLQPCPMPICFSIALQIGGCGITLFSWLTIVLSRYIDLPFCFLETVPTRQNSEEIITVVFTWPYMGDMEGAE